MYETFVKRQMNLLCHNYAKAVVENGLQGVNLPVDIRQKNLEEIDELVNKYHSMSSGKTKEKDALTLLVKKMMKARDRGNFRSFIECLVQCNLATKIMVNRMPDPTTRTVTPARRHSARNTIGKLKQLFLQIIIDVLKIFFRINYFGPFAQKMNIITVATLSADGSPTNEGEIVDLIKKMSRGLREKINANRETCFVCYQRMRIESISTSQDEKSILSFLQSDVQYLFATDVLLTFESECEPEKRHLVHDFFCLSILGELKKTLMK